MKNNENQIEQYYIRLKKIEELKKLNIEPFNNKFIKKNNILDILNKYNNFSFSQLEENKILVSVAGRIILKRIQGKAGFLQLQEFDDSIQIYINSSLVSEKSFKIYQNSDLGDIIGVNGFLFKTKTNQLTIKVSEFIHLSKSLMPLPDKFKGLQNKEIIRKKRYIGLIMNSEIRKIFVMRSKIIKFVRKFFDERGFLEVETPILNSFLGGAAAKPFKTYHNALESDFYLRIATEIPLKKLIVGGMNAIYEIGRVFRNEGVDAFHNPEFTTLEAYLSYSDMQGVMKLTEEFFKDVCKNILGTLEFYYQNNMINFKKFYKYDMIEIINQKTGIDFSQNKNIEEWKKLAIENDIELKPFYKKGHIIIAFFEKFVEHTLIQPTFIYNFPIEVSPLSQVNINNNFFSDRFELFISGKEFVNAFSELNDPIEQKKRFQDQLLQKQLGNDETEDLDKEFLEALEYGMPPTGGLGIGIDRLVMLLTNTSNIRDVILFPHFKNSNKI
ncbi:lysine--tRNA ligase [Texas Phoenix palm phytoplasma]|uniref:Lysine--tRNA ligase n=1 Tax=Texas Phoenix palm phytoplasma TaxID=176709 RepID=A0ABS5BIQ2_9MOLU|nr:lysine--tRNA ligase [Texas Phoenix palm phytoplasma]MBP3059458.1 lysine--tRNA ligase [Texas Phoenix palm phytoplasma]